MNFFSKRIRSRADFYSQIAFVLVIVLLLNLIFAFLRARIDVTEGRIYSISNVTKQTLKNLDDIITIKAYFTKDLPGYLITVRQQVKDMLAEYKTYGKGKIRVKFFDPSDNKEIESNAKSLGIPPLRFNIVKKDKFEVAQGYLGIAVIYGDKTETIPVIQNTANLEYDLTSSIKKVVLGKDFVIGVLQKQGVLTSSDKFQNFINSISKQYKVKILDFDKGDKIDDSIDTLIIPGPSADFEKSELYQIDQYIMSGKGVFLTADGVIVSNGLTASPNQSNIFGLLEQYGITINNDLIFDTRYRGSASFSQGFMSFVTPYGFWPSVLSNGFNKDSVLVNKLESVTFPWVSSIDVKDNISAQKLAFTSPESKLVKDDFDLSPQQLPKMSGSGKYVVTVSVNGELKSYFNKALDKSENMFTGQTKDARLIVISDADLINDSFIMRNGDNLTFLQNLVDGITLDSSLAEIRSKNVTDRPIKELDSTMRMLIKYGNIIGIPFLVILFAMFRFAWRRKTQSINVK